MASHGIKECSVCEEDFDVTNRSPRTLPCSHYMCAQCINNMISNNSKLCPFCRCSFEANSADEIMINRAVLDFLNYLGDSSSKPLSATPLSDRIAHLEKETAEIRSCLNLSCEDAKEEVLEALQDIDKIKTDLQFENDQIDKEVMTKIVSIKQENERKQKVLKSLGKNMNIRLTEITEKQTNLKDMNAKINAASSFKEAAVMMDEAKVLNLAVGEWTEYCKTLMADDKRKLQTLEKDVKEARTKTERTIEALRCLWEEIPDPKPTDQLIQDSLTTIQVSIESLQKMNGPMKSLLEQGLVYAMKVQEVTRFAKITFRDNKLHLHSLKADRPPENAYVIYHGQILTLVEPASRLAFLELGTEGSILGRMYIRLSPDTDGAKQFAMLCTGQHGPSYANTKALTVADKGRIGEHVRFGDYEFNNGTGGKALVTGLCKGEQYQRPDVAGIVTGNGWAGPAEAISAQFNIRTRSRTGKTCNTAFAQVEENLNILIEVVQRYPKIRNVSIVDCGLVIPTLQSSQGTFI